FFSIFLLILINRKITVMIKYFLFSLLIVSSCLAVMSQNAVAQTVVQEKVYEENEVLVLPVFPGGDKALDEHFYNFLKPHNIEKNGAVVLSFVVTKEGVVQQTAVDKTMLPEINSIVLKAAEAMPVWNPGMVEGKKVNVRVRLPLYFNYKEYVSVKTMPFEYVDHMPQFPGGKAALGSFVTKHLQYPESEIKSNIRGTVWVRFMVDINGKVSKPEVLKGINPAFDNEAINVVNKMPKWEPGKQFEVELPVMVTIPIKFFPPVNNSISH
ncbi:MAG: energy transducer TonB, partial [Hymenobacteraceae bacterium]|nr:energy transducer TonB [Hymenobacteraceae bacterium]